MNRYIQSVARRALALATRHMDRKTQWDLFRRRLATSDPAECFNKLLPSYKISREDIEHYFRELAGDASLRNSVESYKEVIGKDFQAKMSGVVVAANLFCYVATRILKPEIVIETGCATGWTSSLFSTRVPSEL